jgi:hypothetical protein
MNGHVFAKVLPYHNLAARTRGITPAKIAEPRIRCLVKANDAGPNLIGTLDKVRTATDVGPPVS